MMIYKKRKARQKHVWGESQECKKTFLTTKVWYGFNCDYDFMLHQLDISTGTLHEHLTNIIESTAEFSVVHSRTCFPRCVRSMSHLVNGWMTHLRQAGYYDNAFCFSSSWCNQWKVKLILFLNAFQVVTEMQKLSVSK